MLLVSAMETATLSALSASPAAAQYPRRPAPAGGVAAASAGNPLFPAPAAPSKGDTVVSGPPGPGHTAPADVLLTGAYGIPATVLDSYRRAATTVDQRNSGCDLGWALLAAIGKVESNHAEGGDVTPDGEMINPVFGPALNGASGTAAIQGGAGQWARAMGPMQFIPSSWAMWATDGNGDGTADPQNVYDASATAARYLCAAGGDLSTPDGMSAAVWSYNHSESYLTTVLGWYQAYQGGVLSQPDQPGGSASMVDFTAADNGAGGPSTAPPAGTTAPPTGGAPAPRPIAGGPPKAPSPGNGGVPPAPPTRPAPPTPPSSGPLAPVLGVLPAPVGQLLNPILRPVTGQLPGL
ncbi:MAG TPA: lytic transglycosylase domain-containing protein [Pseudonocardiaceae bacterium]|jgi:hypothetical protein|nr:lytic transglycosylase domain-containing protein [Pseudonocardiaceae bacterium]